MERKLHISFVIQDLYRLGAQYVTSLLAKGLAARGHHVDVVVSGVHDMMAQTRPDLKPFSLPETVRMVHLPRMKASQNVFALSRYFKESQPDVVVPMSSNYEPACALALLLRLWGKRPLFIPVEHLGGIGMTNEQSRIGGKTRLLEKGMSRVVASLADKAIAVSQGVAGALVQTGKYPREKVSVIYNPVVDDGFMSKKEMPAAHPWLAEKSAPVIMAAGAHVPLKGYDLLLQAFSLVLPDIDCRLILFGEGNQTEILKAKARALRCAEKVSFPGHSDNLPAEMRRADVFVVSSHCESFSVVLVEALACGVPVVATDCPSGPREILHGGRFGTLVPPNDPRALADGITNVLRGKGILPVQESWAPFTLGRIVDCYEHLFAQQVKERSR